MFKNTVKVVNACSLTEAEKKEILLDKGKSDGKFAVSSFFLLRSNIYLYVEDRVR